MGSDTTPSLILRGGRNQYTLTDRVKMKSLDLITFKLPRFLLLYMMSNVLVDMITLGYESYQQDSEIQDPLQTPPRHLPHSF